MKFEVRYPTGARHEVTLEGTLAVVGRDPTCDLVLNDVKCSRRHAVIEAGPQGMAIRDSGSANGVFVNGKRVERSVLEAGDVIRLGEIVIKVLPEEVGGTVVMGPEELETADTPAPVVPQAGPVRLGTPLPTPPAARARPPAPKPPAPKPPAQLRPAEARPATAPIPRGAIARPMTLTLLSLLWGLAALIYVGAAVYFALDRGLTTWARAGGAVCMLFLALLGLVLAFGLWMRHGWARMLQLVVAVIGLFNCPFTLAAVAVLVYLMRAEVKLQFQGRREWSELEESERAVIRDESSEGAFTATLVGTVLVGTLASALLFWWGHGRLAADGGTSQSEAAVLADLHELHDAERNFRDGTAGNCGSGFADLDGLLRPFGVIPGYRSDGPVFLGPSFEREERYGYRFTLETEDPLPARDGCPKRAYQRFRYHADPKAGGRHFVIGPDGVVRVAPDRTATLTDSPLR